VIQVGDEGRTDNGCASAHGGISELVDDVDLEAVVLCKREMLLVLRCGSERDKPGWQRSKGREIRRQQARLWIGGINERDSKEAMALTSGGGHLAV
jgi:hypothetical protein